MSQQPEGYEIPLYRALCEEILMGGLQRKVAFLYWTVVAAVVVGLRQVWFLSIAVPLYLFLLHHTKKDNQIWDVGRKALFGRQTLRP